MATAPRSRNAKRLGVFGEGCRRCGTDVVRVGRRHSMGWRNGKVRSTTIVARCDESVRFPITKIRKKTGDVKVSGVLCMVFFVLGDGKCLQR